MISISVYITNQRKTQYIAYRKLFSVDINMLWFRLWIKNVRYIENTATNGIIDNIADTLWLSRRCHGRVHLCKNWCVVIIFKNHRKIKGLISTTSLEKSQVSYQIQSTQYLVQTYDEEKRERLSSIHAFFVIGYNGYSI